MINNTYLSELNTIDTIHLGEKATEQVNDFVNFVKPLIPDIRKGDAAKAKVAQYYLENKDSYTDASKKMLETFLSEVGVSNSYVSQLKKANEFKQCILNPSLKRYVEEHPTSTQYHLSKIPHDQLTKKMLTGEHYTFREAVKATKGEQQSDEVNPVSEKTETEYQQKLRRQQEMVDSNEQPLIRTKGAAEVFMVGSRKDVLAAAAQVLFNIKYRDEDLVKVIDALEKLCAIAKSKPYFTQTRLTQA